MVLFRLLDKIAAIDGQRIRGRKSKDKIEKIINNLVEEFIWSFDNERIVYISDKGEICMARLEGKILRNLQTKGNILTVQNK